MSLGFLVTMGIVSYASGMIQRILSSSGKMDDANLVEQVSKSMMITSAIGFGISAFTEIRKMGK